MIPLRKNQRPTSLLALALDSGRLTGAVVRRTNGHAEVQQHFSAALALDPLTNDAELVGQEIRNRLDEAGIRERRCVVCLPPNWALTLSTQLPALPEDDIAGFLQLEAERAFPQSPEELLLATSRLRAAADESHATLIAVPRDHALRLDDALRAARLTPVGFSFGITSLQPAALDTSDAVLALTVGETSVGMQLTCAGGIAVLRSLDGACDTEGGAKRLQTAAIAREIRITLGQLAPGVRAKLRHLRVFGGNDFARQLAEELAPRLEVFGLETKHVTNFTPTSTALPLAANPPVSGALALAAQHLAGAKNVLDFLPPRVSAWQQFTARYSSKKMAYAAVALAVVVLVVGAMFLWQQRELNQLRDQWDGMSGKVKDLETLQAQIKRFRPWFDESYGTLSILRRVTEAFPEDGVVTAKTVEIRDLSTVSCSGTARDRDSVLKTLDRLRATREITDVKLDQIRGTKPPLQFSFNFHWGKGGANER